MLVSDLTLDDVETIAALHLAAFPHSALSTLGEEAVRRHYRWQFEGPHDLTALGAFSDDVLVGFLLGGVFRGSTSGFVKRERWFLVGQVLRHPHVLAQTSGRRVAPVATRLLLRRSSTAPEQPSRVPAGSLGVLVVAVDPDVHRLGVGTSLLRAAEASARRDGFERMHLTLHPGNVPALSFYTDQGWRRLGLPGDDEHQWLLGKELGAAIDPGAPGSAR
ncbi:GNAT family N-acetyltransferase [Aquihabitans sp. G128]|uniref:GNAT family N-acetyltransferase n=1 Tax=Aquihabitans sp. G128 TaxID=2849779 RepID=UPI001C2188AF|nr:GNAT family N-acetyltransferase [Aquihabitans sp. G128]QXC60279.1 GNAT family N-acetyltransferase [Aquihabitans sp. G128]